MPRLEYRSLRFEEEWVEAPPEGYFQEAMVVNHPSADTEARAASDRAHASRCRDSCALRDARACA
eukprot:6775025-Prymnesium_polylepis.1